MIEIRDDNLAELLTALSDGELDADSARSVWNYLVDHPDAMRWLQNQQLIAATLRQAKHAPAPADLRSKIESLVRDESVEPVVRAEPAHRRRIPWLRFAAAVAAGVLIGVMVAPPRAPHNSIPAVLPSDVLPISTVVEAGRIHASCSRLAEALHSASFDKVDAELAHQVLADLNADHPDLSSIGFHFVGAGPCEPLMKQTVHLLYHSSRPGSVAAISIFVQPNHGQFKMDTTHVYAVSSSASPFPMVAWQTTRIVYFLVTDNERTQASAMKLLNPSATEPTAHR